MLAMPERGTLECWLFNTIIKMFDGLALVGTTGSGTLEQVIDTHYFMHAAYDYNDCDRRLNTKNKAPKKNVQGSTWRLTRVKMQGTLEQK